MNFQGSMLPVKAPSHSIIDAILLLMGVVLLATGYFGGFEKILYLGFIFILIGVLLELVFGFIGRSF